MGLLDTNLRVTGSLFDHDRYVLAFSPAAGVSQRIATLGSVVALDLIRAKARRAAASSSS